MRSLVWWFIQCLIDSLVAYRILYGALFNFNILCFETVSFQCDVNISGSFYQYDQQNMHFTVRYAFHVNSVF